MKIQFRWNSRYGSQIWLWSGKHFTCGVMLNGRAFTFYKGVDSGKWTFSRWDNVWRKTAKPLPRDWKTFK